MISKYGLRKLFSEAIDDDWESITTSAGSTTSNLVDTALLDISDQNEAFGRKYFMMHSGLDEGNIRQTTATGSIGSSGIVTTTRAWGSTIQADEPYSMHTYDPRDKDRALRRAMANAYPGVFRQIADESIIVDNLLSNPTLDIVDRGVFFDGTNDEINVTDETAIQNLFNSGTTIQVKFRAYSDGSNDVGAIFSKNSSGYLLRTQGEISDTPSKGTMGLAFVRDWNTTDGVWATDNFAINVDEPTWVTVTYDDGSVNNDAQLYVGRERQRVDITRPVGTVVSDVGNMEIGSDNTNFFNGVIYEFRIWDRVLTPSEIARSLDVEYQGNEDGLVMLLPLDEITGTTIRDISTNDIAAALSSAAVVLTADVRDWQINGELTNMVVESGEFIIHGGSSIKLSPGTTATGLLSQDLFGKLALANMSGKSVTFRAWCWTATADKARLNIDFGVSSENGTYHTGNEEWTLLEVTAKYPENATKVDLQMEMTAGTAGIAGYFALPHAYVDAVASYVLPDIFDSPPKQVLIQADENEPGRGIYVSVDKGVITGRLLRILGKRPFTLPDAENELIPMNPIEANAIVAKAKEEFYKLLLARNVSESQRDIFIDEQNAARLEYDEREAALPLSAPSEVPQRWSTHFNGERYVLQLDRGLVV